MRRWLVLVLLVPFAACSDPSDVDGSVRAGGSTTSPQVGQGSEPDPYAATAPPGTTMQPVSVVAALVSAWRDGSRERAEQLVTEPSVLNDMFRREPSAPSPSGVVNIHCSVSAGGGQRCSYPAGADGLQMLVDVIIVDGVARVRSVEFHEAPAPPLPPPSVTTRP